MLDAGFIWDDDDYVTENPALTAPGGLLAIWTDPSATPQYYPLTHTTFWLEARLYGLRPAGFRAVNVGLHGISCVLLALVLRRLRVPGAWLAAAVFAVHPVHVESVAWIAERKDVLSGFFFLLAIRLWLGFSARMTVPRYLGTLACFALALMSKPMAVTLPAVVTTDLRLNEPRYASLPNIMKAGMKPVEVVDCAGLGIEAPTSLTTVKQYAPPPPRGECTMIDAEDPAAAARIAAAGGARVRKRFAPDGMAGRSVVGAYK